MDSREKNLKQAVLRRYFSIVEDGSDYSFHASVADIKSEVTKPLLDKLEVIEKKLEELKRLGDVAPNIMEDLQHPYLDFWIKYRISNPDTLSDIAALFLTRDKEYFSSLQGPLDNVNRCSSELSKIEEELKDLMSSEAKLELRFKEALGSEP